MKQICYIIPTRSRRPLKLIPRVLRVWWAKVQAWGRKSVHWAVTTHEVVMYLQRESILAFYTRLGGKVFLIITQSRVSRRIDQERTTNKAKREEDIYFSRSDFNDWIIDSCPVLSRYNLFPTAHWNECQTCRLYHSSGPKNIRLTIISSPWSPPLVIDTTPCYPERTSRTFLASALYPVWDFFPFGTPDIT